jgi:long-chain acyl-CoA synthetase
MIHSPHLWLAHYPEGVDWHADIPVGTVQGMLERSVARFPEHICLDFKGRLYTYREIGEKVRRFARGLQEMGVKKGGHVGLFMPNCPQFVISYFAILTAGGTVVNYNPLYSANELAHQIEDSRTEIMVTLNLKLLYDKLSPCIGNGCLRTVIIGNLANVLPLTKAALYSVMKLREMAHIPHDAAHIPFAAMLKYPDILHTTPHVDVQEDIAVLQYTGGTTGTPKGVMLTHANLSANAEMCRLWFYQAKEGQETIVGVLPFFHVFAMTVIMNFGISAGFRILLHPRFELAPLLSDIQQKKPALMAGVPTMFTAILNATTAKGGQRYDLSSLKMCISGGAALPLEIKERFEAATGCVLIEGYGLSESSPVVSANPLYGVNKAGSIGLPFPQTVLEVVDKDDEVTLLGQGEIGEICIRGAQVMKGYWNNDAETAHIMKGGRLHTGDLGYMDADGYFHIVDRKKEMILSGGYNIYPRHIEEVLYSHSSVVECAVIGVAHPVRGQVPKAFVVVKEGAHVSEGEMRTFLKANLSAYSIPQDIIFRESLPKSMIGKILKKELK